MSRRKLTITSDASDNDCDVFKNKKMKTDAIIEQGSINYISVPSLESIALTKIVVELCKQPDLGDDILSKKFKEVKEKISKKLNCLPTFLKDKVSNIILPIGMQIVDWSIYLLNEDVTLNDCKKGIGYVCWTMEGTIDKKKTLELFLNNKILENVDCIFNAACRYCAEDNIADLWEWSKKSSGKEYFYSKHIYESYKYHLIAYWTCFAKNELHKLLSMIKPSDDAGIYDCNHTVNKNMCTLSVSEGNALAAKYFWKKLTEEEISDNITMWTELVINSRKNSVPVYEETNEYTDILCFLLSQMNDKQQRKIFQEYSATILSALFFDWRWRKFLLQTIQVMWDFLDGNIYENFLLTVLLEESKEEKSMMVVKELWCNSPKDLKIFFMQHGVDLCYHLMYTDQLQVVEKFLNLFFNSQVEIDEFKKLLIRGRGADLCYYKWMLNDKWQLVEKFLDLFFTSQDEIDEFKKLLITERGADLCYHKWMMNDKWKSVEKFLDLFFTSENEIDEFKNLIVSQHGASLCGIWMLNDKWQSIGKFLDLFFTSQDQIHEFKKRIIREHGVKVFCSLMSSDERSVEKFLNLLFTSQDQIDQFKKDLPSWALSYFKMKTD